MDQIEECVQRQRGTKRKHSDTDDRNILSRKTDDPSSHELGQSSDSVGVGQLVADIYNKKKKDDLNEREKSRIFFMRNFNNWIKSMTIKEITGKFRGTDVNDITILDMCCGQGGDIPKWMETELTRHVVFVDIAEKSLRECRRRYYIRMVGHNDRNFRFRGNNFSAEFYTADCTKERLRNIYMNPDIRFDLVSVQFALHYSFESVSQAQMMLKNISENLNPGGFFIGTTANANRIVKKFRKFGKEFGNDIYSINLETPEPFPLFGAKYSFQMKDAFDNCPEFLVNFPAFVKLAEEKYGLNLVYKHTFDEYFEKHHIGQDGHFLLKRMRALETYPPCGGRSLASEKDEDYIRAKRFQDDTPDCGRFGTISKSEWEVVSLYLTFAFQKVR